jgi:hypothetical protein
VTTVRWKSDPDDHDYDAASDYLELLASARLVEPTIAALRCAPESHRKAKDILRASGLISLDADNHHVAKDVHKIHSGIALSPVLLVRGDITHGSPLVIADGYHRICAVHLLEEDAEIPCRIADLG